MMQLQKAAQVLQARWQGENVQFTGVSTDSRTLRKGDLFVALTGERFEGWRFVRDAHDHGAVAAMVGARTETDSLSTDMPFIFVNDTRVGLGQLAAYWRSQFSMPLIAITGSNGKTTVKDMLATILHQNTGGVNVAPRNLPTMQFVLATEGNLNNDIGMPLMLLRMRDSHQFIVIEMGMNHMGEIAYLTQLAKPDVAVITNAGHAHLEGLGSVEAVAQAKGEIFAGLSMRGIAVINADDQYASLWRTLAGGRQVIDFGMNLQSKRAQVFAEYQSDVYGSKLFLHLPDGEIDVYLQVPGVHNIRNALAAAAAAVAVDIDKKTIAAGLQCFKGVRGRLQIKRGRNDSVLIDDSYNANPDSVRAALAVLSSAKGKKILVLGDMGELGEPSINLHRTIGEEARCAKLDELLTLGELSRYASEAFGQNARHFVDMDQLLNYAERLLDADVTMLIKGSRFMHMEQVIKGLEASVSRGKGSVV
ncbi:UDP-N-acetylmuramoyl-tripeptide--D-alanyl-D-alanine ligase [Nitrosomonas sp.]|uniref:UDP-N-acetylmuramoyl-tripeptide--D-alanyl-D- alanine ligase n=1 Tax=Nitrosomonas sp. TaxID=42353 RepID=UPI002842C8E1|nr:UDP-N-acetylmuramoyl-tripeptide--D-alanyl-D-alanine ligase [Nitrosomonas sp.]MCP5243381.1 UDP-N-acetylmuramoyl-tripeptide--D-alanyl-D-alanine ligase [Burkholderiales bacterium]MDR4514823.1 UDP-N-acetylmuramoyl-tripeptide--D-alanyl-D-alanine ligase [Nitrosomonas sp.]